MFKNKWDKYLLRIVHVFGIQFGHEVLFLFPMISIRLEEGYELNSSQIILEINLT